MGSMCGGEVDQHQQDVKAKTEAQDDNLEELQDSIKEKVKKIDKEIKELGKGNKNDGKNDKIFKTVKGEPLKTLEKTKYLTVVPNADKKIKAKASKGKGFKYQGEHDKKDKEGFGIRVKDNGEIYQGMWSRDAPKGFGRQIEVDGAHFTGTFDGENKFKKGTLVDKKETTF